MSLNLDSAAFRAWLEAQWPTDHVGMANCPDMCPLACWYGSQGYDAFVDSPQIELYGENEEGDNDTIEFSPPPWQAAFIEAVDEDGGHITAAAALEILARVERMEVTA